MHLAAIVFLATIFTSDDGQAAQGTDRPIPATDGLAWADDVQDFEAEYRQTLATLDSVTPESAQPLQLMRAVMLASVLKRPSDADKYRGWLIEHHSDSLECQYLLSAFPDASKLLEFVTDSYFKKVDDVASAERAIRVIRGLFKTRKYELLKDQRFAANACLASLIAGDREVWAQSRRGVASFSASVFDIANDASMTLSERFQQIQDIYRKRGMTQPWPLMETIQRHLARLMSDAERCKPQVAHVLIDRFLRDEKLADAAALLDLCSKNTSEPQLLFQQAVCLARLGKSNDSLAVIGRLLAEAPESDWHKAARVLARRVQTREQDIANVAALIRDCLVAFRKVNLDCCDVEAEFVTTNGPRYRFMFLADFARLTQEAILLKDDSIHLAVKTDHFGSYLLLDANQPVRYCSKLSLLPDITLKDVRVDEKGEVHFTSNFGTGQILSNVPFTWHELVRNERLGNQLAISLIVANLAGRGAFPSVEFGMNGRRTLHVTRMKSDTADVQFSTIEVNEQNLIESASIQYDKSRVNVKRLSLGSDAVRGRTTGHWPEDKPVQKLVPSAVGNVFGELMSTLIKLFAIIDPAYDRFDEELEKIPLRNDSSKAIEPLDLSVFGARSIKLAAPTGELSLTPEPVP